MLEIALGDPESGVCFTHIRWEKFVWIVSEFVVFFRFFGSLMLRYPDTEPVALTAASALPPREPPWSCCVVFENLSFTLLVVNDWFLCAGVRTSNCGFGFVCSQFSTDWTAWFTSGKSIWWRRIVCPYCSSIFRPVVLVAKHELLCCCSDHGATRAH